jgi:hypothetical protein
MFEMNARSGSDHFRSYHPYAPRGEISINIGFGEDDLTADAMYGIVRHVTKRSAETIGRFADRPQRWMRSRALWAGIRPGRRR